MPHIDSLSLPTFRGQSVFARPVAAVTHFVRGLVERTKDREARLIDEAWSGARDSADLQRLERDYEYRDGGGVRSWEWR